MKTFYNSNNPEFTSDSGRTAQSLSSLANRSTQIHFKAHIKTDLLLTEIEALGG